MAQKETLKGQIGVTTKEVYSKSQVELWEIAPQNGKDVAQIIREYKDHPDIAYIEPDYMIELASMPDEFCAEDVVTESQDIIPEGILFDDQWGLHNIGQSGGTPNIDINAPEAWDSISTSPLIKVAVIDTGIDWGHEDLVDNIWQNLGEDADGDGRVLEYDAVQQKWVFDPGDENGIDDDGNGYADDFVGWDFADNDNNPYDDYDNNPNDNFIPAHGTHVAGIIGARGDNGLGIAGVTWDVQMAALKVFGDSKACSDAIEAIDYATAMGFSISNSSWGLTSSCEVLSYSLYDAIEVARDSGHLFVAAAGNAIFGGPEDNDNLTYATYPASYDLDNIISVTAINRLGNIWNRANYGANSVDIGAPGVDILSCSTGYNGYFSQSGTSMATPHVTGACALLWGLHHDKTYADIKATILNTVTPTPSLNGKCLSNGRLNLYDAITGFTAPPPPPLPSLCRAADSLALLQLKTALDAIDSGNWSNWDSTQPIDTWYGVELGVEGCLEGLSLYSHTLPTLPPEIRNLTNLKSLEIPNVGLTSLPAEIGNLTNLEYLNLRENELASMPVEISNLTNLKVLNLNRNKFTSFDPNISTLPLKELYLGYNGLTFWNIFLSSMVEVEILDLSHNQIATIPPEIAHLDNLRYLYLTNNQITTLPSEIGNLTNLEYLNVYGNGLTSLPESIEDLNSLEILNLSYNNLTTLFPVYFLSQLKELYAAGNQLSTISSFIDLLTNLERLDLSSNNLTSFPSGVVTLTNLNRLYLNSNQITTVPSSIGNLTKLVYLGLSSNQITLIPFEIGNLINLNGLSV